ncbi:L-arabinose isomerase [Klebsiella quasipneumoniae]|nr:L-arabinose isomerase [Klebsiella quasipneumoniae]
MTIFDNYEIWFVIGSQHLYGPEALRQVTKHAEHVVNSLNAEAKLPCKLVLKPLAPPRTKSLTSAATLTTMTNAPG